MRIAPSELLEPDEELATRITSARIVNPRDFGWARGIDGFWSRLRPAPASAITWVITNPAKISPSAPPT